MKKLILPLAILMVSTSFHYRYQSEADKAFMIKATQGNLAEVEAAKLAVSQSASDSIRLFAQMMIEDHTTAQSELAAIAKSQNVTLPDSTDDEHRMFKQRLMLVQGKSFDSAYMQSQVRDHIKTIALFKAEISNGVNAETKAYASKLLPKLQMHFQHAQNLAQGNMNGMQMQQ